MRTDKVVSTSSPDGERRHWLNFLVAGMIALTALWPAAVNGGPFFMADTPSYARGAASGFYKVFGVRTEWTDEYLRVYAGSPDLASQMAEGKIEQPGDEGQIPVTLSGRSIFYGVVLYLSHLAGSLWLIALIQGVLVAACIVLTVDAISKAAGTRMEVRSLFLTGLLVVAATPVGFFAGYLMPDIFGAFALLATANILFLWRDLSRGARIFWFAMLAYSLLVHSVNLIVVAGLVVLSLMFSWWRRMRVDRCQLAGLLTCIVAAFLGQSAFGMTVKSMTGAAPVRPPFIAMRLIADGPGMLYLRDHCSTERYIYCRVLGQAAPKSDTLLWSKDRGTSLFRGLSPDEQRLSAAQQSKFVKAVLLEHPGDVIGDAAGNTIGQIAKLDLNGFNYSRENRGRFRDTVPAEMFKELSQTRAYRNVMPTRGTEILSVITALLASLYICAFVALSRTRERLDRLRAYCVCILAGIALNAVICGALSGPKGRYEMRVIWVLPLLASAIALTGSVNWRRQSPKWSELSEVV